METILVTEPEFRKAEQVFRAAADVRCEPVAPDERALAGAVASRGVRAVIVGVVPYLGPLYEALGKRNGAIIARVGVGHDGIDKPRARQHGILVTNTPGVLDASVAEHTMWLMGWSVSLPTRKSSFTLATSSASTFQPTPAPAGSSTGHVLRGSNPARCSLIPPAARCSTRRRFTTPSPLAGWPVRRWT